jgi:hypothetical protein
VVRGSGAQGRHVRIEQHDVLFPALADSHPP